MRKISIKLIAVFILINISNALFSNPYLDSLKGPFSVYFSYKAFVFPKPFISLESGYNVIKIKRNYGDEFEVGVNYINKAGFGIGSGFSWGRSYYDYCFYDDFIINVAATQNYKITKDEINVLKDWEKPLVLYNIVGLVSFNIKLLYDYSLSKNNGIEFGIGLKYIRFKQSSGFIYGNMIDIDDMLSRESFFAEQYTNSYPGSYKSHDLGLNISIGYFHTFYHYHTFSISLYHDFVRRYLSFIDYRSNTSYGYFKGKIIQPVSVFGIMLSYKLDFMSITHFSR